MSNKAPKHQTAFSAGGVCYRFANGVLEVVLIATMNGTRWGLPKGQPNGKETPEETAAREIAEETGILGEVIHELPSIDYWFRSGPKRIHKLVDFFLLRSCGGHIRPQLSEVDDARWFPLSEAIQLISFPREREILERVQHLWRQNHLV